MAAPVQLQIRYVAEEDRVHWRINTDNHEEFRFWLTRRFLSRLWPVLRDSLYASPNVIKQSTPAARQTVLSFEHEKVASEAAFHVEFKPGHSYPLGEKPLLLTQAKFKKLPEGNLSLSLESINRLGVDFTLTNELLHLFCKLLDLAMEHSEWNIPPLVQKTHQHHSIDIPPKERLN